MKNFHRLIEHVINNDDKTAQKLFHDIIVQASRRIYEDMENEDELDETGMDDVLDEVEMDENWGGMMESDDDMDDMDDMGGEEEHEEIEDAVVRIEDKLDQLMAEFEQIMGGEEGEEEIIEYEEAEEEIDEE